jgi:hypothetical protein
MLLIFRITALSKLNKELRRLLSMVYLVIAVGFHSNRRNRKAAQSAARMPSKGIYISEEPI